MSTGTTDEGDTHDKSIFREIFKEATSLTSFKVKVKCVCRMEEDNQSCEEKREVHRVKHG